MKKQKIDLFFKKPQRVFFISLLWALSAQGISFAREQIKTEDNFQSDKPHSKHLPKKKKKRNKGFEKLDKDKNQKLTFEEFASSKRLLNISKEKQRGLFNFLDKNKDGELDLRELRPPPPRWLIDLGREFPKLDKNQSKTLNFNEFSDFDLIKKMKVKNKKRAFRRIDQNRDSIIDLHELKMALRPPHHRGHERRLDMRHFDTNQSGGLDFSEYLKITWIRHMPEPRRKELFKKIDINQDGEISPIEIRHHRSKHPPRPPHHQKRKFISK